MKDYFLFPKHGESVKLSKEQQGLTLSINQEVVTFDTNKFVKDIEELLTYIKKYGVDDGKSN